MRIGPDRIPSQFEFRNPISLCNRCAQPVAPSPFTPFKGQPAELPQEGLSPSAARALLFAAAGVLGEQIRKWHAKAAEKEVRQNKTLFLSTCMLRVLNFHLRPTMLEWNGQKGVNYSMVRCASLQINRIERHANSKRKRSAPSRSKENKPSNKARGDDQRAVGKPPTTKAAKAASNAVAHDVAHSESARLQSNASESSKGKLLASGRRRKSVICDDEDFE
eukprot:6183731-Pleurochrysis_carterae.AAC.1